MCSRGLRLPRWVLFEGTMLGPTLHASSPHGAPLPQQLAGFAPPSVRMPCPRIWCRGCRSPACLCRLAGANYGAEPPGTRLPGFWQGGRGGGVSQGPEADDLS